MRIIKLSTNVKDMLQLVIMIMEWRLLLKVKKGVMIFFDKGKIMLKVYAT